MQTMAGHVRATGEMVVTGAARAVEMAATFHQLVRATTAAQVREAQALLALEEEAAASTSQKCFERGFRAEIHERNRVQTQHLCQRCIHPAQQQGRRMPPFIFESAFSIRISRVSAFLPLVTQQIHSLRASGVMSSHKARTFDVEWRCD